MPTFFKHALLAAVTAVAAVAASLALPTSAHAGSADIGFEHPERYSDAGRGQELAATQQAISRLLDTLARERLPTGQTLKVTVTEIDLAGEMLPQHRTGHEVRVLRGRADWPRIGLRWVLTEGDRVRASGSETVVDMNYLHSLPTLDARSALPHEERLLTRWFQQRFGAAMH
jgi:hypothetical protein